MLLGTQTETPPAEYRSAYSAPLRVPQGQVPRCPDDELQGGEPCAAFAPGARGDGEALEAWDVRAPPAVIVSLRALDVCQGLDQGPRAVTVTATVSSQRREHRHHLLVQHTSTARLHVPGTASGLRSRRDQGRPYPAGSPGPDPPTPHRVHGGE